MVDVHCLSVAVDILYDFRIMKDEIFLYVFLADVAHHPDILVQSPGILVIAGKACDGGLIF